MGHALDAHKSRARSIALSNTSEATASCGTITVESADDGSDGGGSDDPNGGGTDDPNGGGGTDDPSSGGGGFLEENGLLLAGAAIFAGAAVAIGRR